MSLRNIHLKPAELAELDFHGAWERLGLDKWEPVLVADKEDANRYRIEKEGEDEGRVLCVHRAVSRNFKPFKNSTLLHIGNTIFNQKEFTLTQASVINHGEKIIVKARLNNIENFRSDTRGIGDLEPSLAFIVPVAGTINIALTTEQLFCSNQIPFLRSNPLNRFFSLDHRNDLEEKATELRTKFNNISEVFLSQLQQLERYATLPLSDEGLLDFYAMWSGCPGDVDFREFKPKMSALLEQYYDYAPNAAPGTLLGALNSVTHYLAMKKYRSDHTKSFAQLPTSPQYNQARKALKLINTASHYKNPAEYFAAEFDL